jgi:uncharacterized protein YegP (UPF0339 family)
MMKFIIGQNAKRTHYNWRLMAGNGEKVAFSPVYTRKANCLRQMWKLVRAFQAVGANDRLISIEDETIPMKRGRRPKEDV